MGAGAIALAANQSMDRITPQVVMIVEIFLSESQPMNALTDQFLHAMFDVALVTVVNETAGKIS
jgi:hypothetical protein